MITILRNTSLSLFFLTHFLLFSQEESVNKSIQEVVEVNNLDKTKLFSNALSFFANNFVSANDVIQIKDEPSGKIIGKGIIKNGNDSRKIKISIDIKDNKYRYTIDVEPFVEQKTIEIADINKLGMVSGKTFVQYSYINGELSIDKDKTYFVCTGNFGCNKEKYYYSGKNEIIGLSNSAKEEWKKNVDEKIGKIITDLLDNPTNKDDSEITFLISNLKKEMSTNDEW